jgi:Na+/phosphate symporter
MKISFLNEDYESLQSYESKIDPNQINNFEYNLENELILTHLNLFKFGILLNKMESLMIEISLKKQKKMMSTTLNQLESLFRTLLTKLNFLSNFNGN